MKELLVIASAALILSSCKKNMNEITAPAQPASITGSISLNESLDNAAMTIAASLKDQSVRSFIKSEALKQFDGDYDILYQSVKNNSIKGRSLESILSGNTQARLPQANGFEKMVAIVPNFQISVPVHCDKWNEMNYTPLVAISQPGVNEKDLKQIKAYDSDGNVHFLDAKTEPDQPVIVVGMSERVDETGKLKYNFENGSTAATARTNGQNTILGQIRCPNLSSIESWANGKPELRLRVFGSQLLRGSTTPTAVTITTKFYNPERSAIDGVWYTANTSLFNWYYYWTSTTSLVYGSQTKFAWIEEDGGTSVKINVSLGGTIGSSSGSNITVGVKTSFTIQDNDEDLGDANVYFTDGTSWNVYSTGVFEMEFD
jgi:hypothetical protein